MFYSSDDSDNFDSEDLNTLNESIKRKLDNMSTTVIENIIGLPLKRKKTSEVLALSSSSSNSSDCDSDDSSSKYY